MKKIILFILVISLTSCSLFQKKSENSDMKIYELVDTQPEFPGGYPKLLEYLGRTITYPEMAKQMGIKGTVYAQFIVEKDGQISGLKIIRGFNKLCDQEVIRVLKLMPKWTPGKNRGKIVRVKFTIPVRFTLR